MRSLIPIILVLIAISGATYVNREALPLMWRQINAEFFPCKRPIAYSIGAFDERFDITRSEFLRAIEEAEAIWEKPLGRELFSFTEGGVLGINLIYDSRQATTEKLEEIGGEVDESRASYDRMKKEYDGLIARYDGDQAVLEKRIAEFEARNSAYNKEVAGWNKKRGAPKDVYERLSQEQEYLESEAAAIQKIQNQFNASVDRINALARELNRLAGILNIKVATFNEIGRSRGEEFTEGNYRSGSDGIAIDVYEFENTAKLVRLLAHELGHALGLDHVEGESSIMYRLNTSDNTKLSSEDLSALRTLCRLE